MSFISGKCCFVQCEEVNVRFVLFYCIIFVLKMFSCSKTIMLNKFVIHLFPISCIIFEIKTLTQNFAARWHCKRFQCVAHGHFTLTRHYFYNYSSFLLEIKGWQRTLAGTLYIYVAESIYCRKYSIRNILYKVKFTSHPISVILFKKKEKQYFINRRDIIKLKMLGAGIYEISSVKCNQIW